jgi:hypothetical protein
LHLPHPTIRPGSQSPVQSYDSPLVTSPGVCLGLHASLFTPQHSAPSPWASSSCFSLPLHFQLSRLGSFCFLLPFFASITTDDYHSGSNCLVCSLLAASLASRALRPPPPYPRRINEPWLRTLLRIIREPPNPTVTFGRSRSKWIARSIWSTT